MLGLLKQIFNSKKDSYHYDELNKINKQIIFKISNIEKEIDNLKILIAESFYQNQNSSKKVLSDYELRVFSQWGEDGIIQFLVNRINPKSKVFIEIGVEEYKECNTRYLLINNNWKGIAIDSDLIKINKIYNSDIMWKYEILPVIAFVTKENINDLIKANLSEKKVGLLSIDIDGNDYWIWNSIDCIEPDIVICEYQSMWGFEHPVTIPYTANFNREETRFHNIYYSASLPALIQLAKNKNYSYVGSNKVGSNAFFVKNEHLALFSDIDTSMSLSSPGVREYRDINGELNYRKGVNMLHSIGDLPLYHTVLDREILIKDLYNVNI